LNQAGKRPRIVLATRNMNKVVEIEKIIGDLVETEMFGDYVKVDIPEFGRSLFDNSYAKAAFAYRLSGKPSLADDSGLFVDSLGGEPGIYSARYGENDEARIKRLLKNLEHAENRTAAFRVVFVYYFSDGKYSVFEGECAGRIAHRARGRSGFGYDPVFVPDGYKKTFAELGPELKNRISHRAKALQKFREYLLAERVQPHE